MSIFDAMRNKIIAVEAVLGEKYKLTVTGIVTYGPDDSELKDLLLTEGDKRARLPEALQELEEEATDVKITLEKIS